MRYLMAFSECRFPKRKGAEAEVNGPHQKCFETAWEGLSLNYCWIPIEFMLEKLCKGCNSYF